MVCKSYNSHILSLLNKGEILWKCSLSNGEHVWSDFDLPDEKDPWTRLNIYCYNNGLKIKEVVLIRPGTKDVVIFKDDNYLDNFFIIRGMTKDLMDNSDEAETYRYMAFGILKDGKVHVEKYYWPEFPESVKNEIRELTPENEKLFYKQRKICGDNCGCQSKEQK